MTPFQREQLKQIAQSAGKRPRTVIDHILEHGYITTKQLKELYGYDHPPRAARDVRELGIPLVTFRISDDDGKSIAAYKFGENFPTHQSAQAKSGGRTVLSKKLKVALLKQYGEKCFIHLDTVPAASLQIDHRVPYEINGEDADMSPEHFMLLCPAANREKSWACEHCKNFQEKDKAMCQRCFWAFPEDYDHIAGIEGRHLHLVLTGELLAEYRHLMRQGETASPQWDGFLQKMLPLLHHALVRRPPFPPQN